MGRKKQKFEALKHNAAVGHKSIENRHERIKRELREKIAVTVAQLEIAQQESAEIREKLDQNERIIKETQSEIQSKLAAENDLKIEIKIIQKKFEDQRQTSEFVDNQVSLLRQVNLKLKDDIQKLEDELRSTKKSISQTVSSSVDVQGKVLSSIFQKKIDDLEKKVAVLVASSPTGGSSLKPYKRDNRRATTNHRCRKALESLKRTVDPENFNDFLTDLCHFIAKDPEYSFKLTLSDHDAFLIAVKFRFSDGFLKDFKSFLTSRLGFDIFPSRQKIDFLRKLHSCYDDYSIETTTILKHVGSREVECPTAVIQVKNLSGLLSRRLEMLHDSGQLVLDEADSPIVIGVGGDKGGEHTKIVLVLGNVMNPNNPHGLLLLAMFEGQDDYHSLKTKVLPVFKKINDLETIEYNEKGITVTRRVQKLPIGDCKYLSAVLGHSGSSSSSPCFACNLKWTYRGKNAQRLATFDFSSRGDPYTRTDLKEPLFHADPSSVCPPQLHIFLGIVQTYVVDWMYALCNRIDFGEELPEDLKAQRKELKSLHDQEEYYNTRYLQSKECSELCDVLHGILLKSIASGRDGYRKLSSCDSSFCFYSSTSTKESVPKCDVFRCGGCEKQVHEYCSFLITAEDRSQSSGSGKCYECRNGTTNVKDHRLRSILKIKKTIDSRLQNDEEVLDDVVKEREKLEGMLNKSSGSTRQKLEYVLRSIKCDYRAFYQQLTGNQARTILRVENIRKLLGVFCEEASENLESMEEVMLTLGELMTTANNEEKSDDEIERIRNLLCRFEHHLKQAQPEATVTPKLHLLCAHLMPYLEVHRSWGHISEQGIESLHPLINSLNVRFSSVRNVSQKAELIVKHVSNYNYLFDSGYSWFKSS